MSGKSGKSLEIAYMSGKSLEIGKYNSGNILKNRYFQSQQPHYKLQGTNNKKLKSLPDLIGW